jgi:hypothetical protein
MPINESLSRRTSTANGSCSSLTRRRSLVQTPGVATRNSPVAVEGRRRTWNSWRSPQIAPEEEARWAVSSKGITPLNRLAVPEATRDTHSNTSPEIARTTRDPYSEPRARTPSDMDYSHLGTLELGTLSIVNGAPSPAASTKIVLQKPYHDGKVDYFTPTDAESSPLTMKTTRRRGHVKSKSSVLPGTAPFHDISARDTNKAVRPTTRHGDSRDYHNKHEPLPLSLRIANPGVRVDGHNASKYAQDYQAYIPYSPFATTNFSQVKQGDTSMSEESASLGDETTRILTGTMFDTPTTAMETAGLSSQLPSSSKPPTERNLRPTPRTADSGYSSGGSLRLSGRGLQSASSMTSSKSGNNGAKDEPTLSPSPQSDLKDGHGGSKTLHIPERSGRPSTSDSLLSPMSPSSTASKSSEDSTSSKTQKRLQRRRPSQPELPVMQSCQSIPEGTIPSIPDNVRAKFTRRLSHTPDLQCLTHTYPSKDHVVATNPDADTTTPKAPTTAPAQLAEIEPERPPPQPAHGRHRSLSLFRRKSTVENKEASKEDMNASLGVVDLGTIASSLGSSPYDAAMSGPQRKTVTSPTHPHQLGGALPRAKSMVSMDSEVAAEFARMRSKDRALMEQEMPQQRRRSYHNLKMEAGEAKPSKRRPHMSLHDIPPVPTIDMSKINSPVSMKPRPDNEAVQKAADVSIRARSQPKGEVVSELVEKYDKHEENVPKQTLEWDDHARHWSYRRKSIGEGLRTRTSFNEASASTVNSRNNSQPRLDMAAWGRYSGGLAYDYEGRDAGVGGSAGTRSLHSAASSKSMQWRYQYGVDLSDVPIMVQRV